MQTFTQFNQETISTNRGVFALNESITHIEDLSPQEFLNSVKNLANLIASEKLDGANLIVGFDMEGRLYTSRETKGGTRMYKNTAPTRPAENGFCAAFTALNSDEVRPALRAILNDGDAIECELLFGRQPNAIVYGSNYIAFLRAIPGDNGKHPDQQKIHELNSALKGKTVRVELSMISTIDGTRLITKDETVHFKFTSTVFIDQFEFYKVNLKQELHDFEKWLLHHPPDSFKTKKAFVEAASKFMLPIKEKLVDSLLRFRKPGLRDTDVEPHENIGIEGIVLFDPATGKQFKLVDRGVFTIINQFNHAIRNEIKRTSRASPEAYKHLYKEFNATTGVNGSVYDGMLHEIALVTGIPGLGSYMDITRTIKRFGTREAFLNALPQNVDNLRAGIVRAIHGGLQHLDESKNHFEHDWQSFVLTLGSGRKIKYSKEVYARTLLAYAEAYEDLTRMLQEVQNSKTVAEIANALFGKQLKAIR